MITEAAVIEALRPVEDPELHRSIVDLDMVRGVHIAGGTVGVQIASTRPSPHWPESTRWHSTSPS